MSDDTRASEQGADSGRVRQRESQAAAANRPAPKDTDLTDPFAATENSRAARQIPSWLAEHLEAYRRRQAERQADRAQFAATREHGLKARHATKLRRSGGDRR